MRYTHTYMEFNIKSSAVSSFDILLTVFTNYWLYAPHFYGVLTFIFYLCSFPIISPPLSCYINGVNGENLRFLNFVSGNWKLEGLAQKLHRSEEPKPQKKGGFGRRGDPLFVWSWSLSGGRATRSVGIHEHEILVLSHVGHLFQYFYAYVVHILFFST